MKPKRITAADIDSLIIEVRGKKVILDAGLASVYGVPTKALNRAVKRNLRRFPREVADLRYRFGTSKTARGGRRYLPYAFTEHAVRYRVKRKASRL